MMDVRCIHLKPIKAFHAGQRGVGIEASTDFIPSDTLFSALCWSLRAAISNTALEEMLEAFLQYMPPFLCSGGFPYIILREAPLRFYPAPHTLQALVANDGSSRKGHKARWLSESVFRHYVTTGRLGNIEVLDEVKALVSAGEHRAIVQEYEWLARLNNGRLPLWTTGDVPRVAIDRVTNAGNIFRAGLLSFVQGGGLWVAFEYRTLAWCEQVLPLLLEVLGDQGLGGERSSGYGQFNVQRNYETAQLFDDPAPGGRFVTLSYYHPRYQTQELESLGERAAYGLDVRRGWMSSPENSSLRRKSVRMITMGSVLHTVEGEQSYGELVNVTPDAFKEQRYWHPVWRYGYAFPIGMRD